ncbi:porin [Nitrospira sp.]|nr:porin [Nitrospira sp.]
MEIWDCVHRQNEIEGRKRCGVRAVWCLYGLMAAVMVVASVSAPRMAGAQDSAPTEPPTLESESPVQPQPMPTRRSLGYTETTPSLLEDVLLEKGVITTDDWARIKAEEEQKAARDTAEQGLFANPRWYDRIRLNGYVQLRYSLNDNSTNGDTSLTDSNATNNPQKFYFRRIRMPIAGQVSERLFFYTQMAFEGTGFDTGDTPDIIDAFGDYLLTKDRQFRLRFGLQRVLNSFDTSRSSSQRIELDRHESVQSGAPGERDLGISFFWTSKIAQARYQQLAQYHNGPGDYGNFGVMVYNGQGRNKPELNANKAISARLGHPFELPNGRLFEIGLYGYLNEFVATGTGAINSTAVTRCANARLSNGGCQIKDQRLTGYFWTPPQPWGIFGEYTIGRGPERDDQGILREQSLSGGYLEGNYSWRYSDVGLLTPYVRWGTYYGGNKNSQGADYMTRNAQVGVVWEPDTHWRFVVEYLFKHGATTKNMQYATAQDVFNMSMLRFQAQWFWN